MSTDVESPNVFGADEQHDVEVDVARWVRLARRRARPKSV